MSAEAIDAMLRDAKTIKADGRFDLPLVTAYEDETAPKQRAAQQAPAGGIKFRSLGEIMAEHRETRWLIHKVIKREVLAVLAGPRSTFKSFIALDWMMRAAVAGEGVVILSGRGAGLDRRADAWMRTFAPNMDIASLPVVALERPVNLNVATTLACVVEACRTLPWKPVAVMIDTLSKFSPGMNRERQRRSSGIPGFTGRRTHLPSIDL